MNILFDIGHPAHVHLFKNLMTFFKKKGYNIYVVSRDKDITNLLLKHYEIDYISLSTPQKGIMGMILEMIARDLKIFWLHQKFKFDIAIGTSVSIGHLSLVSNVLSYNFNEDDDDVTPLYTVAAYPFCTKIINPVGIRYRRFIKKRVLHHSFQKLAYLHPDNFIPDIKVIKKYGLESQQYIVLRCSALEAHHDFHSKGIDQGILKKISKIIGQYKLVSSNENDRKYDIEPWDMHHVLFYSKLLITDSMSMAVEASVLGVPSIRYNSFVGKSSVLNELEEKYMLTYGYKPDDSEQLEQMYEKIKELIEKKDLNDAWQRKREKLLKDKEDLNNWMKTFFEIEIKKML